MKTVQDYKQLGLVFIQGDYINTFEGKKQDPLNRYGVGYCNDSTLNDEKFAIEFAWRNNDGTKPEYKGVTEVTLNSGQKCTAYVSEITWIRGFGSSVAKWRPVVSMRNHTELKPRHSFVTAISIDGPKFTIREEAPKTTTTVNIEGRDYLLVSHAPTVSPKEDKPMKPVYTAEMHAKNELPPVGAECLAKVDNSLRFNRYTIMYISNSGSMVLRRVESEIDLVVDTDSCEFKPIIKTIKVNGFDVPAPMSDAPKFGVEFFVVDLTIDTLYERFTWDDCGTGYKWVAKGICHSTKSAAIAHAKAMLGIDPNESN